MIFSIIFFYFFLFFVYYFSLYHLSFGILFIAGENEKKTDPDVENKAHSCDDPDNQHNLESVVLSANNCKQNSVIKHASKQMSILDYCKTSKLNMINDSESPNVEKKLNIESAIPPPTNEITSTENGCEKVPPSSDSFISSGAVVKLIRQTSEKSHHLPVEVTPKLRLKEEIDSVTVAKKVSSGRRKSSRLSYRNESIDKNCLDNDLAGDKVTVINKVRINVESKPKIESISAPSTNVVTPLAHKSDSESPSSISSAAAVKSRKRTREKSVSSPVEVSAKVVKKDQNNSNKRKSVSQPSQLSISSKSSKKHCSTNGLANQEDEEEEIYAVEKVVGVDVIENKPHFHIKWKGYSASQNTWEPLSNLSNCAINLTKFLTIEFDAKKTVVDSILSELNDLNTDAMTDEVAFEKLKDFDAISVLTDLVLLARMKGSDDGNNESCNVIRAKIRQNNETMLLSFWYRRREQLKDLEAWQNDINESDKSSKITVENNVDFEKSPSTFDYINDCVAGEGVVIPDDPLIGCDCEDGCSSKSNCCGKQLGSSYAYTSTGHLRLAQGNAIFECNKRCKCGPECSNRVVQHGRKHSLTIFKTSNGRGWGVRTDRVIAKGQYICEYVGEIITNKEAEARGHIYDAEKRTYLFDLDCNSIVENTENLYTIDACKVGNVSRMINHSCDPNIGTWSVWINCLDLDIPKICFFALRRIEAGEELSFDYLNFSVHDVDNQMDDDQTLLKTNFECKCNSEKCRKYIFDPSLLNPVKN